MMILLTLFPFLPVHQTSEAPAPLFTEIGEIALPGVTTICGSQEKDWILEVNGGGLAVEDFDRDGFLDLVVVSGSTVERAEAGESGDPPRLFLGREDGGFEPAPESWEMAGGRFGMGVATGDVNGDGYVDLFITQWGPDRLFLNEKGAGFKELPAERSGLAGERWGTSAEFLDFDGDDVLDLVVINYLSFDTERVQKRGSGCNWKGHEVMCGPEGLIPVHDQLYRGKGDGSFEEVSVQVGFRPEAAGYGLGVLALDYDKDGDTDLYVTNDSTPNHLWENDGGRFKEVGFRRGVSHDANGKEQAGMGVTSGDLDGDGRLDLFVTNFSGENNSLYSSSRKKGFRERSGRAGLFGKSLRRLGWGTGMDDLDLDGDLDLWVLNGHVYPQASLPGTDTSYAQGDQYFEQIASQEGPRFEERTLSGAAPGVSRAGVTADLDGDGDLDLVAIDFGVDDARGAVRVLRNETIERAGDLPKHWLAIELKQPGSNSTALGAGVTLTLPATDTLPERTFFAEVRSGGGFQASAPARVHWGLGERSFGAATVQVRWPDGQEESFAVDKGDRLLRLERTAAKEEE